MPDETIRDLLQRLDEGDRGANERLYPLVYDELRRMARGQLRGERAGHTLQATALANEAYLRLVGQEKMGARSRAHFLAIAGQAMRRILIDYARKRASEKRGGKDQRVDFEDVLDVAGVEPSTGWLSLEDALKRLETEHPEKVRVVEMRFFAGLTHEEIAEVMGVSVRTIERSWAFARAWLYRELSD